jgi:hypothetical protein
LSLIFAMVLTLGLTTSCKKNGWNTEISIGVGISLSAGVDGNFSINFGNGNIQTSSSNIVWGIVCKDSTSAVQNGDFMTTTVEYCGSNPPIPINTGNGWNLQNPLSSGGSFDAYTEGQQTFDLNSAFNPSWNSYTVVAVQLDLNQVNNGFVKIVGVYTPNTLFVKPKKAEVK